MTSNPKNYFFQKLYEKYYDSAPYIHDAESISDYRERIRRTELINRAWKNKQTESKIENFTPFEVTPPVIEDSLEDEDWNYKLGSRVTEKSPIPSIKFKQQQNNSSSQSIWSNILRWIGIGP